jgi:hypothetical protein
MNTTPRAVTPRERAHRHSYTQGYKDALRDLRTAKGGVTLASLLELLIFADTHLEEWRSADYTRVEFAPQPDV